VKSEIIKDLSTRTGIPEEDVNNFVAQWSHSANDSDMRSLSIQQAASEEFGVPLSEWQQSNIEYLERLKKDAIDNLVTTRDMSVETATDIVDSGGGIVQEYGRFTSLMPRDQERALLRAMYDNTQESLAAQGFKPDDKITLFRGVRGEDYGETGDYLNYEGNTLGSWSVNSGIAERFATEDIHGMTPGAIGTVFTMDVPVRNIVGTAKTGFGCLSEGEFACVDNIPDSQVKIHNRHGGTVYYDEYGDPVYSNEYGDYKD
jgi:hypothetical protein